MSGLYLFHATGWISAVPTMSWPSLLFIAFVTLVIFGYLYNQRNPAGFTQLYLLSMVVKLAAFLAYNFFIVMKNKSAAMSNVAFFLICYIAFTALEISFLYKRINEKS